MTSFDEKVSICLESNFEFADITNKIHDNNSKCNNGYRDARMFSDKLHSYVHSKPSLCKELFSRFV